MGEEAQYRLRRFRVRFIHFQRKLELATFRLHVIETKAISATGDGSSAVKPCLFKREASASLRSISGNRTPRAGFSQQRHSAISRS